MSNLFRLSALSALLISLSAGPAAFAHKKQIEHETCRLHLLVNNTIKGWDGLREYLIDKGYELSETPVQDSLKLPEDSLIGTLGYSLRRKTFVNWCKFEFGIQKVVKTDPFEAAYIFNEIRETNNTKFTFRCNEKRVMMEVPECVKK